MLFVAHPLREAQDKLGLPVDIYCTFTEELNEKKPMEALNSRNWRDYNRFKDGVPVPERFRLPPKLFMVCKGLKRFAPDFFSQTPIEWIVSAQFLAFLHQHKLLEGYYEESKLAVVSTGKKPIADKQYHLLRLFRNDNELIDFDKSLKVLSSQKPLTKHTSRDVYYSDLVFREGAQIPPLFFLDDQSFWYSFICNDDIKTEMEKAQFSGFGFYTLEEYVHERLEREKRFAR
jgi:hypothetical protein